VIFFYFVQKIALWHSDELPKSY